MQIYPEPQSEFWEQLTQCPWWQNFPEEQSALTEHVGRLLPSSLSSSCVLGSPTTTQNPLASQVEFWQSPSWVHELAWHEAGDVVYQQSSLRKQSSWTVQLRPHSPVEVMQISPAAEQSESWAQLTQDPWWQNFPEEQSVSAEHEGRLLPLSVSL